MTRKQSTHDLLYVMPLRPQADTRTTCYTWLMPLPAATHDASIVKASQGMDPLIVAAIFLSPTLRQPVVHFGLETFAWIDITPQDVNDTFSKISAFLVPPARQLSKSNRLDREEGSGIDFILSF